MVNEEHHNSTIDYSLCTNKEFSTSSITLLSAFRNIRQHVSNESDKVSAIEKLDGNTSIIFVRARFLEFARKCKTNNHIFSINC